MLGVLLPQPRRATPHQSARAAGGRLIGATKGHALLKKKADALNLRFRQLLKEIIDAKEGLGGTMRGSFFAYTEAQYAAGDGIKHTIVDNVDTATVKIRGELDNVAGVKIPKFKSFVVPGDTKMDLAGAAPQTRRRGRGGGRARAGQRLGVGVMGTGVDPGGGLGRCGQGPPISLPVGSTAFSSTSTSTPTPILYVGPAGTGLPDATATRSGLGRGGQQLQSCKKAYVSAVELLVQLANLQVGGRVGARFQQKWRCWVQVAKLQVRFGVYSVVGGGRRGP